MWGDNLEFLEHPTAKLLLESFRRFKRMHWNESPVHGFKPSEIMLMFCVHKGVKQNAAGIKVSELSGLLRVTSPTVTQLVKGLEARGFVERNMDEKDRRAVRIKLTEKGYRVIRKAKGHFAESFNGLVEYLGEEQSLQLAELLNKVSTYYDKTREAAREQRWNGDEGQ